MQNLRFCNTGNELPVVALLPREAVHTAFTKPMALQPLLAALQTTMLFAIEGSIKENVVILSGKFHVFLQRNGEKI